MAPKEIDVSAANMSDPPPAGIRRLPEPPKMVPWQSQLPSVDYEQVGTESPRMQSHSSSLKDEVDADADTTDALSPPLPDAEHAVLHPAGLTPGAVPRPPSTYGYTTFQDEKADGAPPLPPGIVYWTPTPLKTWFWATYVTFLVLVAVGLEVARLYSSRNNGWKTTGKFSSEEGIMHYIYTLPPVGVAMIFVGLWAWTDIEVKRMQPYVDLAHGDSPAERSLLLDYTRTHNFFVWLSAAVNKHHLVALTSLMAIVGLSFQPLAAALFTLRQTYITLPDAQVTSRQAIGLNQDQQFQDLTSFLGASGYASSSILYNLGDPNFVKGGYTVALFDLPYNLANNGSLSANTSAILSDPGCQNPDQGVQMNRNPDGSGSWNNSATFNGCTFSWTVNKTSEHLFGAEILPPCSAFAGTDVPFLPAIFWFFTYEPTPMASVTMCAPRITLQSVAVDVDLHSGNITAVNVTGPFATTPGTAAGNITGAPLDGKAYNGLNWTASQLVADPFVMQRATAIQLQLPAAVFQNAVQNYPGGLTRAFDDNAFAPLSAQVYTTYLAMIARLVYFTNTNSDLNVRVSTTQTRLWIDDVAAHLLVVALLMLAFFGTLIQILHRHDRRDLRLLQPPGTLASAAAITASSNISSLLDGQLRPEDMGRALKDRRFRIDPETMKVVMDMDGGEGYAGARSPGWRRSAFAPPGSPMPAGTEGEGAASSAVEGHGVGVGAGVRPKSCRR
ncbi:hypothetical protein DENSPDRAFT_218676 [Dentipellis sp. KUC8613]|nr:hypothetical protein DENSPDRAFT_218676 [Dentipellis sp. KUC8613]